MERSETPPNDLADFDENAPDRLDFGE